VRRNFTITQHTRLQHHAVVVVSGRCHCTAGYAHTYSTRNPCLDIHYDAIMGIDPLSPIAPARINTLLVPAGRIQRKRFSTFVSRLERENVVRLGDVSPDGQSRRSMLFCIIVRTYTNANCLCFDRYVLASGIS
jgi:Transport protein Trs120 or TRAPPC9, TRAPP II complex subunit